MYCDVPGSPCLSKKGESNVQFVPFKRIPGPVSCRCPGGSLETPPRWHVTVLTTRQADHVGSQLITTNSLAFG